MRLSKKIGATALTAALAFTGVMVAAPPASALGVGQGIVDIYGPNTPAVCAADGLASGCYESGAGVVAPNPWSTNEVITAYHVVEGMSTVYVYDPITETTEYGYVQRYDQANDLAVIWIYQSYSGGHFTAAPTFTTSILSTDNPETGTNVLAEGDGNQNWEYPPAVWDQHYGTDLNSAYPSDTCGDPGIPSWTLYNPIQVSHGTIVAGDSGGPLFDYGNPYDPNNGNVMGINDCIGSGSTGKDYAIQIGWAYYDMLNTRP